MRLALNDVKQADFEKLSFGIPILQGANYVTYRKPPVLMLLKTILLVLTCEAAGLYCDHWPYLLVISC